MEDTHRLMVRVPAPGPHKAEHIHGREDDNPHTATLVKYPHSYWHGTDHG